MKTTTSRLAIVSAIFIALTVWTHARPRVSHLDRFAFDAAVPLAFDGWIGRAAPPLDPAVASVLAADEYVHRFYMATNPGPRTADPGLRPKASVEMDIAYYAQPQAGAAMHSPLNCLPGNGWEIIESRTVPVAANGATIDVRRLLVAQNGYRVAMTYWFQNRGVIVGNEYRQRFQLLANGLQGRPTDAAIVRVMARDDAAGHVALQRFTSELAAMLGAAFR
jgi:EpsI family protein